MQRIDIALKIHFALLAALQPTWVPAAVWVFTAMVAITVGQRVVCGVRFLRDVA